VSDQFGFKGDVTQYGRALLTEQLEANLYAWLQWSLLGVGAFDTVTRGRQDARAADRSRLRPAPDPRYPANTVWQAHRGDWCWESGVPYAAQPLPVTGVWVGGAFYPTATTTGALAHRVNYPLGQVFFSGAVPPTAVVQAEYSPRFVQVRRSDEPWFHAVCFDTLRADNFGSPSASGGAGWDLLAEARVQLPALVVEPAFNGASTPLEIGGGAGAYREDFLVHVLAETPWDRKRLTDVLRVQVDKRLPTFDLNAATLPLDGYGRPVAGAQTYPQMCQAAPWAQVRIVRTAPTDQDPLGTHLYWSTVRLSTETDLP
jgi:hypothetical protein